LRADSGYGILPRVLASHNLIAVCYFHSIGFDHRRLWSESSINKQSQRPPIAASGKLPKVAFRTGLPHITEATAMAQPEINHITRRNTWQQNR
jgi:hypothetical protein